MEETAELRSSDVWVVDQYTFELANYLRAKERGDDPLPLKPVCWSERARLAEEEMRARQGHAFEITLYNEETGEFEVLNGAAEEIRAKLEELVGPSLVKELDRFEEDK